MNKLLLLMLSVFLFSACADKTNSYFTRDYMHENWQKSIVVNPANWARGADHWFMTGSAVLPKVHDPLASVSTMKVDAGVFTGVHIAGGFQVQLFSTDGDNTVYVYGSSVGVSNTLIESDNGILYVRAKPESGIELPDVIVRIGVHNLREIVQEGCGKIEGINLSGNLTIITTPGSSGNIYLSGNIQLTHVQHEGSGDVTVFGVNTPTIEIKANGSGNLNLCGHMCISSLCHFGTGNINLIGATSNGLNVDVNGTGTISIDGNVTINRMSVAGDTSVYFSSVRSAALNVIAKDNAYVGIAGHVGNLNIKTEDHAFVAARYVCAQNAYASAEDYSHINITACNRAFGSAENKASVFFFGPSHLLTIFQKDYGTVIALDERNWCNYASEYRPYSYTYDHASPVLVMKEHHVRRKARVQFRGEG